MPEQKIMWDVEDPVSSGIGMRRNGLPITDGLFMKKVGLERNGNQKSEGKYKELSQVDRFRYRARYFTDSGIIGMKEFVSTVYQDFKGYFTSRHEKRPKLVQGLDGIYSLKRLSENIA